MRADESAAADDQTQQEIRAGWEGGGRYLSLNIMTVSDSSMAYAWPMLIHGNIHNHEFPFLLSFKQQGRRC